ncbi:unnamed protein product [Pieris brassicae]|uniref:Amiloride-sensitive sodium channel n=1 Tax=Pieris brassicae TaxID=7116 RepID=A0A9P0T4A8_PIEBR|nr:unnamed protein product [Pieris brassicae]
MDITVNTSSHEKSSNVSGSDIELFLQSLPNLVDYRNSNGHTSDFDHILRALKKHYFNIDTIMEEVHQRCEDLLLYCSFNRKPMICTDMFRLVKTFEGHCCTFNYVALNDDSVENVLPDKDHEHYEDTESDHKHSEIIITAESGRGSGLLVVFNVEPSDYPPWALTQTYGAKVLINDPNDYPEYSVIYKRVYTEISLDIKVQPSVFDADESLRSIPNAYRGCAFHDEIELKHTDRYSWETCKTECKMRSYLKYCGCVPYKYPQEATPRICEFKDLRCLNNFRAKKLSSELCEPLCYQECRDKQYRVTNNIMPLVADLYPDDVMNNRNASELTALQVYFDRPTCNCYKKMLLMDFISIIGESKQYAV